MNINWLRTYRLITTIHTLSAVFHNPSSSWTKCKHPSPMAAHNFITSVGHTVRLPLISFISVWVRDMEVLRNQGQQLSVCLGGACVNRGIVLFGLYFHSQLLTAGVQKACRSARTDCTRCSCSLSSFTFCPDSISVPSLEMCAKTNVLTANYDGVVFFIFNITSLLTILNLLSYLAS